MSDAVYVLGFLAVAVVAGYVVYRVTSRKEKQYETLF